MRFSAAIVLTCVSMLKAEVVTKSPDGKLVVTVDTDTAGQLTWKLDREGKPVILPSPLGITVDGTPLVRGFIPFQANRKSTDRTYPAVGVHATAMDRSNDATIRFLSGTLELRVFDDGAAYRYTFAGRHVDAEAGEWLLPGGCRVWYQANTRDKNYESRYQGASDAGLIPVGDVFSAPMTIKLPDDAGYAMITEADLVNYSDMGLQVMSPGRFRATMHNDPGGFTNDATHTPWRVTIVTPDLNGLVNTDVIRNLCPPSGIADTSWIKPGRAAWHWRVTGRPKFEEQRQWIDWTSELGFEYYLVDDGWRDWKRDDADAWAMMKTLVDYATTKNVRVLAWAHSNELDTPEKRAAYMDRAKSIGIVGLKLDFMEPANVHWANWYDDTLRDAAARQLVIDYHGCVKPTGRERTWPNELNREAICGREQGKLPGRHDTTLPFVRYVQGHADYTPTDFRPGEMRGNSCAKELAQAVVYTSPLLCYSGDPRDYLKSPALDVIKTIPATWDETLVLGGSGIGEVAAFARRKGDDWYVGVINGEKGRELTIDLKFLDRADRYHATILGDDAAKNDAFVREERDVDGKTQLVAKLRADGGYVARFTPVR